MSFFSKVPLATPDAIFGLDANFQKDPRKDKVDLMVGFYRNDDGIASTFEAVRLAQKKAIEENLPSRYLPFTGHNALLEFIGQMAYGNAFLAENFAFSQALGGTGALFLACQFLKNFLASSIAIPAPSWPNHKNIALQAGLEPIFYPYYDAEHFCIDWKGMLDCLERLPSGTIVLLHACCHNPTGIDLSQEQWKKVLEIIKERELFPLFDMAYQGFGSGVKEDRFALELCLKEKIPHVLAYSLSKNFSVYSERIGALYFYLPAKENKVAVTGQIGALVRRMYSNPPRLSAHALYLLLASSELTEMWKEELEAARCRMSDTREKLCSALLAQRPQKRFEAMSSHKGFFSYTGLTQQEIFLLQERYGIYMIGDGRISLPGINTRNFAQIVQAIVDVT